MRDILQTNLYFNVEFFSSCVVSSFPILRTPDQNKTILSFISKFDARPEVCSKPTRAAQG